MKKFCHWVCLVAFMGLLFTTAAIAQSKPSVSIQKSNTNTNSIQQDKSIDDRIYRLTREEVDRLKKDNKEQVELYIQNRINENMLKYAALFGSIFGSAAGVILWVQWKAEFKSRYFALIDDKVQKNIEETVKKKIQEVIEQVEKIETRLNDGYKKLRHMLDLQLVKEQLTEELVKIIPKPNLFITQHFNQENQEMLDRIVKKLKEIRKHDEELSLTANDLLCWGDGFSLLGNCKVLESCPDNSKNVSKAYSYWFEQVDSKPDEFIREQDAAKYYEDAIKFYDEANIKLKDLFGEDGSKSKAETYDVLFRKANALKMLGKYKEAINCYELAIECDKNSAIAWVNKGLAVGREERKSSPLLFNETIKCLETAIKIDGNCVRAWYNMACFHALLGESDKALENLDNAIKVSHKSSPSNKEIKELALEDPDLDSIRTKNKEEFEIILEQSEAKI